MGINITRKKILMKGFAGVADVTKFLKCGPDKAKRTMSEIKNDLMKENKKTLQDKVPAKRLLTYLDLTEKKIFEYAEIEKKESAGTDSKV